MKRINKIIATIAGIATCLSMATLTSAYCDPGDTLSYSVSSSNKKWSNQNGDAWNVQRTGKCSFYYTNSNGVKTTYTVNQWTTGSGYIELFRQTSSKTSDTASLGSLNADDYFAIVEYCSGTANGTVRLSKAS